MSVQPWKPSLIPSLLLSATAVDIGLDYHDAANEDCHGRLPHEVPAPVTPLLAVSRGVELAA